MRESVYKSYNDLPLFLNSATVAKVLGVSPSSGYKLTHGPGFPVLHIGNRMVVPKEQFIQWVNEYTGGWEWDSVVMGIFLLCPMRFFPGS